MNRMLYLQEIHRDREIKGWEDGNTVSVAFISTINEYFIHMFHMLKMLHFTPHPKKRKETKLCNYMSINIEIFTCFTECIKQKMNIYVAFQERVCEFWLIFSHLKRGRMG